MEIDLDKLSSAKGVILVIGHKKPSDSTSRSKRVAKAWEAAGVASTPEDLISSLAIADNELEKTRELLPSEAFADIALVRMRLALQALSETGEFAPADIESCASKAADYIYKSATEDLKAAEGELKEMRESCPLAIISVYNGEVAEAVKSLGLDRSVHTVVDTDSDSVTEAIEGAMQALGTRPDETIVLSRAAKRLSASASKAGVEIYELPQKSEDEYLSALSKVSDVLEELES